MENGLDVFISQVIINIQAPVRHRALQQGSEDRPSGERQSLPSRSLVSVWNVEMLSHTDIDQFVSTTVYIWFRSNHHWKYHFKFLSWDYGIVCFLNIFLKPDICSLNLRSKLEILKKFQFSEMMALNLWSAMLKLLWHHFKLSFSSLKGYFSI